MLVMIKPAMPEETLAGCRGRIEGWLAEAGGQLEEVVDVGELPLAYEVAKQSRGHFLLFWLNGPAALPAAIAQRVRVDEEILRHLIVARHPAATKTVKPAAERKSDGKRRK